MRIIHCGRCNPQIDADRARQEIGRALKKLCPSKVEDGLGDEADAYVLLGACPSECLDARIPDLKPVVRVGGCRVDGWDVTEEELPRIIAEKLLSHFADLSRVDRTEKRG